MPSLLAMLGEERNTTCDYNGATFVDWTGGGAHPRSFGARAVMGDGGAGENAAGLELARGRGPRRERQQ